MNDKTGQKRGKRNRTGGKSGGGIINTTPLRLSPEKIQSGLSNGRWVGNRKCSPKRRGREPRVSYLALQSCAKSHTSSRKEKDRGLRRTLFTKGAVRWDHSNKGSPILAKGRGTDSIGR